MSLFSKFNCLRDTDPLPSPEAFKGIEVRPLRRGKTNTIEHTISTKAERWGVYGQLIDQHGDVQALAEFPLVEQAVAFALAVVSTQEYANFVGIVVAKDGL